MSEVKNSFDDFLKFLFQSPKKTSQPIITETPKKTVELKPVEIPKSQTTSQDALVQKPPQQQTILQKTQVTTTARAPELSQQAIEVKKVAKDLKTIRQTIAFIKNAPRLFQSSSAALMTAKLATQILRDCGFEIPREVELSIAACQVIAAGGAAVNAGAASGASFGSVAEPTAAAIQAAIMLFQEAGMINMNSLQVQQVNLMFDVAIVAASGGSNIVADVKLIYDMYMAAETSKVLSQYDADLQVRSRLNAFRSNRLKIQSENASQNFMRLANGEMGMFGFATQLARNSAELFPRVLPELEAFFPPTAIDMLDVEYHSMDNSFFNIPTSWASASGHIEVIMSRAGQNFDMLNKWCELFLDPCIAGYNNVLAEDSGSNINKLSMTSLCIMSMLPPYFKMVPENFDVRPYLAAWNLTPYDFYNDDCITAELKRQKSEYFISDDEATMPSPITFNGVDYVSPSILNMRDIIERRKKSKQGIMQANKSGDVAYLLGDPDCNRLLKDWGTVVDYGPSEFFVEERPGRFGGIDKIVHRLKGGPVKYNEPIYPNSEKSLLKNQLNLRNSLLNGNWRNIQNYFAILSMIETLSSDWKGYSSTVDQENRLKGSIKTLEDECSKLYKELVEKREPTLRAIADAEQRASVMTDPRSTLKNIEDWRNDLNEMTARYQARENVLVEARNELTKWNEDAPKREIQDKAYAGAFKQMVWDKYPQVVASQKQINDKYREVSTKMVFRQMNKMGFNNIAEILNVPPEKLVQVNKGDLKPDGPGLFKGI